jgi:hypothetical protein
VESERDARALKGSAAPGTNGSLAYGFLPQLARDFRTQAALHAARRAGGGGAGHRRGLGLTES